MKIRQEIGTKRELPAGFSVDENEFEKEWVKTASWSFCRTGWHLLSDPECRSVIERKGRKSFMTPAQFIFQQFIMTLEGPVHGFCYNHMLTPRNPAQPGWVRVLAFWGIYTLVVSVNWITGVRVSGYINLLVAVTLTQTALYFFFQEKLQTRIFAFMLLFLMQAAADLCVSFFYIVVQRHASANFMEDEMISVMITVMMVGALLEGFGCWLWRKRRGIQTNGFAVALSALVVIFLYMVFITVGVIVYQGSFDPSFVGSAIVSMGSVAVFLLICFYYQQKQKKENEVEWENLMNLKKMQEEFYCSLEEQERKISFIRHDHLNVLGTVHQLLEEQETQEARMVLEDYLQRLETDEDPDVCSMERWIRP